MQPLMVLLLLVDGAAGPFAGLFDEPLAIPALRLVSCAAFMASKVAFALGLPRTPDAAKGASGPSPQRRSGASSL